jgi:hypothetical protein
VRDPRTDPLVEAVVTDVIDGDTIEVVLDGVTERVRLMGIDAPEVGQCGFEEATDLLDLLIGDDPVTLSGVDAVDRYRRLLRFVSVAQPVGEVYGADELLTHHASAGSLLACRKTAATWAPGSLVAGNASRPNVAGRRSVAGPRRQPGEDRQIGRERPSPVEVSVQRRTGARTPSRCARESKRDVHRSIRDAPSSRRSKTLRLSGTGRVLGHRARSGPGPDYPGEPHP